MSAKKRAARRTCQNDGFPCKGGCHRRLGFRRRRFKRYKPYLVLLDEHLAANTLLCRLIEWSEAEGVAFRFRTIKGNDDLKVCFLSEHDALAFKLRWM